MNMSHPTDLAPAYRCEDCPEAACRWLHDEDGAWAPGEKPIAVCCECGGNATYDPPVTYCEDEGMAVLYRGPLSGLAFPSPELAAEIAAVLASEGVWRDPTGVIALEDAEDDGDASDEDRAFADGSPTAAEIAGERATLPGGGLAPSK